MLSGKSTSAVTSNQEWGHLHTHFRISLWPSRDYAEIIVTHN